MILENLINNHAIGVNCCTTSLTTIMRSTTLNSDITEAEIFGLSSGLGFIYQFYKDEGYFVSGRNESLEFNLSFQLGIPFEQGYSDDFTQTWKLNKAYLDKGIPVIVDLNVEYLPYFKKYISDDFRFGLHNAVLVGYDEHHVYLLDHRWLEPQAVPFELYEKARSLDNSSISPKNGWRVLKTNTSHYYSYDEVSVYTSLETVYNRMKNPFAFKLGLEGIRLFLKELNNWVKQNREDRIQDFQTISFLLEKLGTGGGNFRRIYSRYIKTVYKKLSMPADLLELTKLYSEAAKQWKLLSDLCHHYAQKNDEGITELFKQTTDSIYMYETEAIEKIDLLLREKYYAEQRSNFELITS